MQTKPLITLADVNIGYLFRSKVERDSSGEYKAIQTRDVLDDSLDIDFSKVVQVSAENVRERHLLSKGDILFRSRGQSPLAVLFNQKDTNYIAAAPFIIVRPKRSSVSSEFLLWYLNSPQANKYYNKHMRGTYVKHISTKLFSNIEVPLPEKKVQKNIASLFQLGLKEKDLSLKLTQLKQQYYQSLLSNHINKEQHGKN